MAITELPAAAILPTDEAIDRAEQKLAHYQRIRYFERRLAQLAEFYRDEERRIQAHIAKGHEALRALSSRQAVQL